MDVSEFNPSQPGRSLFSLGIGDRWFVVKQAIAP